MLFRALVSIALMLLAISGVEAAGKVALVIGNGAYVNANPLPNPTNDATDMTQLLQQMGFTVIGGNDLDYATMGAKIGEFEDAARSADVTLLFYAGHGMQVNGRNFLIPVNAKLERESSLQFEAIDAETVLRSMSGPGKTAIALLDACRDNPLSRRFARSLGNTRSTAVAQGLAVPSISGGGMLIGFATAPGDVAADGEGRNSPFTAALKKHLPTKGLEIQQLMTRVKADVFSSTKESQEPWHNSSLRSEVYLGGAAPEPTPDIANQSVEQEWNAVKDSESVLVLDAFVAAHADKPVYVALAEQRKTELFAKQVAAAPRPTKEPAPSPQPNDAGKQDPPPGESGDLALLVSLKIPPAPKSEAAINPAASGALEKFIVASKDANAGNGTFALLNVGITNVDVPAPGKNPGTKARALKLVKKAGDTNLDALLQNNSGLSFAYDLASDCRLDWVDRCPHIPQDLFQSLSSAMAAHGLDINNHGGNYYFLNRIGGSEDYLLSNAPEFRNGQVAVLAAIISPNLEIKKIFGFDLSKEKLGVEAGAPEAGIENTSVVSDGANLYLSFDGSHRCTDAPRKFGFIIKLSMTDDVVQWVSPFNTSDASLLLSNGRLLSANGGSCVEDFLYEINIDTGAVEARAKLPTAIERMSESDGKLVLELYEGAGVYELQ